MPVVKKDLNSLYSKYKRIFIYEDDDGVCVVELTNIDDDMDWIILRGKNPLDAIKNM